MTAFVAVQRYSSTASSMALSAPKTTITDSAMAGKSQEATLSKHLVYKGKATHRSWPQLPDELVRLIATFYLHNLASTAYCPQTWESTEFWHQRMVYTTLRDGLDLERNVMAVCLGWHRALQGHLLWQQSISLIDPMDYFAAHMYVAQPKPPPPARLGGSAQSQRVQQPIKLSPWRHLRNVLTYSCAVCRINSPPTNIGLGNVHHGTTSRRTMVHTPYLGMISVCREHEKRKAAFCGLCLRESPTFETSNLGALAFGLGMGPGMNGQSHPHALSQLMMNIACLENEDDDTWPNVDATCKSCRIEWLWRKAFMQPIDRDAIGGPDAEAMPPSFLPIPPLQVLLQKTQDWETRHTLEGFVDMAEGTINDVLTLAREKWWLRKYTKLGDMMMQAVAARKWVNGGGESATDPRGPLVSSVGHQDQPQRDANRDVTVDVEIVREEEESLDLEFADEDDEGREKERAQLAMDLELAVQLEREDREREEGEYVQVQQQKQRARTPSPPASRPTQGNYEAPAIIQFAPDPYQDLERFDDRDEVFSQALSEEEEDDEEEEEEEEDASVMQTEENSVRELALGDWARAKILDGYWVSPADVWYGLDKVYKGSGLGLDQKYPEIEAGADGRDIRKEGWTLAVHPCPWTIEKEGGSEGGERRRRRRDTNLSSGHDTSLQHGQQEEEDKDIAVDVEIEEVEEEEESHPRWETVVPNGPPTYALCEQAYNAHQKQLRLILLPAMRNVVRKIVMECGVASFPEDEENNDVGGERRSLSVSSSASSSSTTNRKRKRRGPANASVRGKGSLRDPALIASRMSVEDVIKVLREEEGVWFEGVNWVERRRNEREAAAAAAESVASAAAAKRKRNVSKTVTSTIVGEDDVVISGGVSASAGEGGDSTSGNATGRGSPPKKRRKTKDGEGTPVSFSAEDGTVMDTSTTTPVPSSTSTTSSTASESVEEDIISSGSGTSPVLSTTTLQTTPSPPPSTSTAEDGSEVVEVVKARYLGDEDEDDGEGEEEEDEEKRIRIPVTAILERPRLLRPIPYIPLTIEGMPHYTMQVLKSAWREACSPLYQCRCRICERAALAAANAASARRHSSSGEYREPQQQTQQVQVPQERQQTVPPPQSPEKERSVAAKGETKEYRIPAIKLRPVKADLPRREEEEEEEEGDEDESLMGEQEEEEEEDGYGSSGEEESQRLVDETDLYLDDDGYDDQYEQVYLYSNGGGGDEGGVENAAGGDDDDVVEIDVGEDSDLGLIPTTTIASKTKLSSSPILAHSPHRTSTIPTRSARKRSCDEQELELDHAGRTVSTTSASVTATAPLSGGEEVLVVGDLGRYVSRAPTPPKRQKTGTSD